MRITSWLDEFLALEDDEELPDELADRILERPDAARAKLLDVAFAGPQSGLLVTPSTSARILALDLLAEMGPHAATAERLVAELVAAPDSEIAVAVEDAIEAMEDAALPPLLAALEATSDRLASRALARCCAGAVGDDADPSSVYERLRPAFERMPAALARLIGELGVDDALPVLHKALERTLRAELSPPEERDLDILDLSAAIESLGGDFDGHDGSEIAAACVRATDDLVAEIRSAGDDSAWDDGGDVVAPPPGPNDPCTCGSGRKYKKCHG